MDQQWDRDEHMFGLDVYSFGVTDELMRGSFHSNRHYGTVSRHLVELLQFWLTSKGFDINKPIQVMQSARDGYDFRQ